MKKQVVVSLCIPCCAVPTGDEGFFGSSWKSTIAQRNGAQPLPQTEASCLVLHQLHSWEEESSWCFNSGTGLSANVSFPAASAWDQIDQSL